MNHKYQNFRVEKLNLSPIFYKLWTWNYMTWSKAYTFLLKSYKISTRAEGSWVLWPASYVSRSHLPCLKYPLHHPFSLSLNSIISQGPVQWHLWEGLPVLSSPIPPGRALAVLLHPHNSQQCIHSKSKTFHHIMVNFASLSSVHCALFE